jgi:predicted outer membrane repeat protein
VSNNSAGGNGGGIYSAGEHSKVLTLTNSTVSENSAGGNGGGIYSAGAYYSSGTLRLTNSTVSGNSAGGNGGAIYNTGDDYAHVSLIKTTVSENSAENSGGGLWNDGYLYVWNSTVSANTGAFAGGIWSFGMGGGLTLYSSTVSGNITFANDVGDIFGSRTYITNTLVNNDCSIHRLAGAPGGYNVESPGDTCGFDQPTDQVNVTAEQLALGPLQDNGGPTVTHALLPGSVAIDAIVCTGGEDQRGVTRPQGPACDVGAFELEVAP